MTQGMENMTAEEGRAEIQKIMIAETIIQQMGGFNRLRAMIGARDYIGLDSGVKFRFSGNRKMNVAQIILNGLDLYDLTIYKIVAPDVETVYAASNLYAEDLGRVFTEATGLDLRI